MELLQAGVDRALIALWLGHESVETTQIYMDADLALKEQVLAKTKPIKGKTGRYRPDDVLLAFLKGLRSVPSGLCFILEPDTPAVRLVYQVHSTSHYLRRHSPGRGIVPTALSRYAAGR
jgi:hypothetical protein